MPMDSDFDKLLQNSLRRVEPPAELTERILAATKIHPMPTPAARFSAWRSLATAAAVLLVLAAGWTWQERRQQQRREASLAETRQAFRIVNEELARVRLLTGRALPYAIRGEERQ
jgi:anti-sigma-K factor RskA